MKFEWDFHELNNFANNLSNVGKLNSTFEKITKDISKALLKRMKSLTPVDSYELINGWNGNKFAVVKREDGFEVLLINKTPYASAVNDGHMAYNQYGGAYPIKPYNPKGKFGKPEGRIQVRSPYQWQTGDATWYVFGHFFVERGILQLKNTTEIESIIMRELEKWWEGC